LKTPIGRKDASKIGNSLPARFSDGGHRRISHDVPAKPIATIVETVMVHRFLRKQA
jgi:hypothetical protein